MQDKSSRFVLLAGLLTLIILILSGCDFAADPAASAPQPTALLQQPQAPATFTSIPQPADPPTSILATTQPILAPPTPNVVPTDAPTGTPADPPTYTPQQPPPTDTSVAPTATRRPKSPTPAKAAPRATATTTTIIKATTTDATDIEITTPEATIEPDATAGSGKLINGLWYDAYVPAATKLHQYYHFTCEFDAAWVVLKTNGIDATLDEQLAILGQDTSIEPRYEETDQGVFIYGGDILHSYSGDYKTNFLARTTGAAMAKVFEHYGLNVTPVHTQAAMEAALRQGDLVWIKTTADFKPGKPATWVMPDGTTYQTVLGNDHAAVVMGYSDRGALIRDVLGPTSTNENRQYEYEVPWPKFMAAWDQQQDDGLAVGK